MGKNVCIDSIQNNELKIRALCVDAMGIGTKDGYLDTKEWNIFLEHALEDLNKKKYSQEDFDQVLGLYLSDDSEKKSNSWVEDSIKNYFCDENGKFDLSKTAGTLLESALTVGFLFAGTRSILSLVKMGKKGGLLSKMIRNKPKAPQAAASGNSIVVNKSKLPQTVASGDPVAVNKPQTPQASVSGKSVAINKSAVNNAGNYCETVNIKGGKKIITKDSTGRIIKQQIVKGGNTIREIKVDINGKKITTDYIYNADGSVAKTIKKYQPGAVETGRAGENLSYPDGVIKEIEYKNWQYTEVCKDLKGNYLRTDVYNNHNTLIRQEFAKADTRGRIKIEHDYRGTVETFADGTTNIIKPALEW